MTKGVKVLKYSGITLLCIVGLIIISLMLLNLAIRPQNVKNLVERYSKEYINAEVKADTIEIHLLRNFPFASISIMNCSIRSLAFDSLNSTSRALVPPRADSLARVGRLDISVSLVDLLFNRVKIKGIELDSPMIYAYISQFGINNWDILKTQTDSTSEDTQLDVNINKISIKNGAQISLCSAVDSIEVDVSLRELFLRGVISTSLDDNYITRSRISRMVLQGNHFHKVILDSTKDNSIKLSIDSLDISKKHNSNKAQVDIRMRTDMKFHGVTLASGIPFDLTGGIELKDRDNNKLEVDLENLTVYAATLPVTLDGNMLITDSGIEIPDVKGYIDNYSIKNLLEYIPEKFLKSNKIETDAAITLRTRIKGKYAFATGEMPVVDLSFAIPASTLTVKGQESGHEGGLKRIEAAMNLHFDQNDTTSNTLSISKFSVEGRGISLDLKGKIDEYTADPHFDISAKSNINLDTLIAIIPMKEKVVASGSINGSFALKGRMSELNLFSLNKNEISGELLSDALVFNMPDQGLAFNCGNTKFTAGVLKNSKDSLLTKGSRIFNLSVSLDTLYLNYKDSMLVSGSKVSFSANQEPPKKVGVPRRGLIPTSLKVDGHLHADGIQIKDADSTRIRLRGTEGSFSITPWTDGRTPVIAFNTGFRGISVVQKGSRFFARNSNFAVKAITHAPQRKMRDSTGRARRLQNPASNNNAQDSTSKRSFDTKRFAGAVLKYWDITGKIQSASGRVITPTFPLRTRFSNFDLTLSNDGMHFQDTKLEIGNSSITLSGRLQGFAKAVTEHQKLHFTGSITADSLDVDQMMQAMASASDVKLQENKSDEAIEKEMQKAVSADTAVIKSPVIPEFLEADINLDLRKMTFNQSRLKSVNGKLIAKNGIFQLNRFKIHTKSGEVDLNAFYAAKKIDDVSVGFDIRMNKFEVADFIEFIPQIDSLLPMMRSFQGKITCTISAMTKVDSLLNLKMETLNGLATIEGENVVLLDGETFAEIAKKLKFKNREKNLIENISVQCVAADNKIEIFPFVLQMDRYKAAISGTQNMNMSFNYHISVLKSPIPFRIGLNIKGTVEDMKFGIGKCRYKSENVPVYTEVLDSARVNLNKQIRSIFLNGVEKTINQGSTRNLAKVVQAEQEKTNGMEELSQSEQRQLDSTKVEKPLEDKPVDKPQEDKPSESAPTDQTK